jgi:hypothetical protein
MRCEEFEGYAAQWMEGERTPEAVAHRERCHRCSSLVADLEIIASSAAVLPEIDPPERVWEFLRLQLEDEGLLRPRTTLVGRMLEFFPVLTRPAFATAALAGLAVTLMFTPQAPGPSRTSQGNAQQDAVWSLPVMQAQLADAEEVAWRSVHGDDSQVVASYQQNLELVDNAIGVCQKKVQESPDDDLARDYLMTAYQQKADLLASLSARDALGD